MRPLSIPHTESRALNLANKISILRIVLIPFFIASLLYCTPATSHLRFVAAIVFGLSVFTDAADGYIARIYRQRTRLGTFLDPIADKLLLVSAFGTLAALDTLPTDLRLPAWLSLIVISRDILIILGISVIYVINEGRLEIQPSWLGKITTFLQMLTILSVLLQMLAIQWLWFTTAALTLLSGIGYLRIGTRLLNNHAGA